MSGNRVLSLLFVCFACAIHPAAGTAGEGSADRKCSLTADRFLTERLSIWQQRLKLERWKISVIMTHRSGLHPNTLGNVRWNDSEKLAMIRVLEPSEYRAPCRDALNDMEFTVVHELIHLKLSSLPHSENSSEEEEFVVEHLANALLRLDRHR